MLSTEAVHGLPRMRAPGIVPCIISFSRHLPGFLSVTNECHVFVTNELPSYC